MRGSFGSIEPCHAMSNQESTRGADAKKLFVRSDFQAVGSATHEQKDIFDQEVTKAFFFVQHNLRTYGCFRKHLLQFLIISLISHNFSIYSSPFLCSSLDFSHYPHFSTLSSLHVSGRVSTSQAVAQVLGSNVLDLTVTEWASHMRASIFLAD